MEHQRCDKCKTGERMAYASPSPRLQPWQTSLVNHRAPSCCAQMQPWSSEFGRACMRLVFIRGNICRLSCRSKWSCVPLLDSGNGNKPVSAPGVALSVCFIDRLVLWPTNGDLKGAAWSLTFLWLMPAILQMSRVSGAV